MIEIAFIIGGGLAIVAAAGYVVATERRAMREAARLPDHELTPEREDPEHAFRRSQGAGWR
jgi:hypothetical protein